MVEPKYTLEEISYSRKEDCRIIEAVLKNWFHDPKTLNFVDPRMPYPFHFKKWVNLSYQTEETTTLAIKEENWIIGYLSMRFQPETMNSHLFHLFIDPKHRKRGHAEKIVSAMEDHGRELGANSFSLFVQPKNEAAKKLYKKLGYMETGQSKTGSFKMEKPA